jgi:hypothetical protein
VDNDKDVSHTGTGLAMQPAASRMQAVRGNANVGPRVRPQLRTMVRYGLIVYFFLVILEGVLRKWIAPDLNQYIYVVKDAVLAFICARVVLSLGYIPAPPSLRHTSAGQLFLAFAIYSLCQGFNPNLPNTLLGLWGIRTYVLPMSLAFLVPLGMPDPRANERYFRYYLLLGIPIAILCMVQYRLPTTHFLNKYANTTELGEKVAVVIDAVRVTGPFSYISGLSAFMTFVAAGVFGVLFATRWKLRDNMMIWLSLLLTIGVVPMTGSRATILYVALYVVVVVILSPIVKQGAGAPSRILLAGICVASLSIGIFGEAFDRLAERARRASDTRQRVYSLVLGPLDLLDDAGLFGYGAAASNQAASVLVPGGQSYYWLPNGWIEDEPGRVMIELGGFGFILYLALKVGICAVVFQYIRRFGRYVPLAIPVACLLTATSGMITGMLFNSVGSSFYWGMFGLFLAQADATRIRPQKS